MIRMIVFDMAGTVIDENNVVYKTLLEAITTEGYHVTLEQVLAEGAGKEKFQAIKDILKVYAGVTTEDKLQDVFAIFQSKLKQAYETTEIKGQPGAEQLFGELRKRGVYIVLNTGYDKNTAQLVLRKAGWLEGMQIDAMITASDVTNKRPAPDMIELARTKFGLNDTSEIAKIGDSIIDIEEGKNAGCYLSIGITTGAQTREQLMTGKPDYVVDSLLEILPLLERGQGVA